MGRQVVNYAAFCAARAALVSEKSEYRDAAQQAAEQVCAWVVNGMAAGERDKTIPGWGDIPGSGGVGRKTRARIDTLGPWNIQATVEHDFALLIPIAGPMIGWLCNPWETNREYDEQRADASGNIGDADLIRYPHIRFSETVCLPKPYLTVPVMGIPARGW